jgi:hypothetical protein
MNFRRFSAIWILYLLEEVFRGAALNRVGMAKLYVFMKKRAIALELFAVGGFF